MSVANNFLCYWYLLVGFLVNVRCCKLLKDKCERDLFTKRAPFLVPFFLLRNDESMIVNVCQCVCAPNICKVNRRTLIIQKDQELEPCRFPRTGRAHGSCDEHLPDKALMRSTNLANAWVLDVWVCEIFYDFLMSIPSMTPIHQSGNVTSIQMHFPSELCSTNIVSRP